MRLQKESGTNRLSVAIGWELSTRTSAAIYPQGGPMKLFADIS